jgi:hypothetical protein
MGPTEIEKALGTQVDEVIDFIVQRARARLIMAIRSQDFATINSCMNELASASKIALRIPDDL